MSVGFKWLTGLAIATLVVRAIRQQDEGHQAPTPQPTAQTLGPTASPSAATKKDWLRVAECLFVASMCVVGLLFGFYYLPDDDNDPELAGRLAVEVPPAIPDIFSGRANFQSLQWSESHDNAHQPLLMFPMSEEAPQPVLPPHTIRARIAVNFAKKPFEYLDRFMHRDIRVDLYLDLPEKADVVGCRTLDYQPGSRIGCRWEDRPKDFAGYMTSAMHISLPKRRYHVQGIVRGLSTYLAFVVDVRGVGMA